MYALSVLTSSAPASKRFSLAPDGQLVKGDALPISSGQIRTVRLPSMADFAAMLPTLGPRDVLIYGLAAHDSARIVTAETLASMTGHEGGQPVISRTKDHIKYRPGPGVLCLDYDPQDGGPVYTHEELLDRLYDVCPDMRDAPMVLAHSASTHIYNGDAQVRGHKGKRAYIGIADATDIHRAGIALFWRLFINGHGWYVPTAKGALLQRAIVDRAMFTAVQPDFAAGAICEPPLHQDRPEPVTLNADAEPMDTRAAIPDQTAEEQALYQLQAAQVRGAKSPARTGAGTGSASPMPRGRYDRGPSLKGDTMIETESGLVSWWHIMQNPKMFDKMKCLDPFRPDADKDAVIHTDGTPGIASFSKGGTYYHGERVLTRPASERPRPAVRLGGIAARRR